MEAADARRAVDAAIAVATAAGLAVDDAAVLNDSNRLVVRLLPCDVVARVSPTGWFSAAREVELARTLAQETEAPVARLDPRVEPRIVERDGFEVALWAHIEAPASADLPPPDDYARALEHLHGSLRRVDVRAPHVTARFAELREWLADGDLTPDLAGADRELLLHRLEIPRRLRPGGDGAEQLLHGEPHPWNLLRTTGGLVFFDFENCARGPIEYDLAWVPDEVSRRYRDADQDLVGECRALVLALIAAHRWRHDDQHPSGRESGVAFLAALRAGPPWPALDDVR